MRIHVVLASMLVVLSLAERKDPIVVTPLGSLEGHWQVSRGGRNFQAYEGIPYAKTPIGELRFEPPQPVAPWEGVLPAKFRPSECLQFKQASVGIKVQVGGAEDCLYLHVYTPGDEAKNLTRAKLLPVIIFIYGGGMQMGEGFNWQPHNLMDKDIVFVSMNHRLGPLGFLSTEDEVVPGNMGLKDQALAIKWVSKNIESFGGDPNEVTLAGMSSGGACVHLHYLSPMSRGLFRRGISASGTAFHPWAQTEASLEKAKKIAGLMGCPTSDNRAMIRCLKDRPAKTLFDFERSLMSFLYNPFVPLGFVVENRSVDPFLDKSPIDIIASGESADLPWLVSSNTEEGIYPSTEFLVNVEYTREVDEKWEDIAPHILDYNYTIPLTEHASVARYVRSYYMGDRRIDLSNANDVIRMIGDRLYAVSTEKAAKEQARIYGSPVWFYRFGYSGEYSLSDMFTGNSEEKFGVAHNDEIYYLFNLSDSPLHREQDIQMSVALVNLWYSFATTGIPDLGVEWQTVNGTGETLNFLHISAPGDYGMNSEDDYGNKTFWSSIDFNENKLSSPMKET